MYSKWKTSRSSRRCLLQWHSFHFSEYSYRELFFLLDPWQHAYLVSIKMELEAKVSYHRQTLAQWVPGKVLHHLRFTHYLCWVASMLCANHMFHIISWWHSANRAVEVLWWNFSWQSRLPIISNVSTSLLWHQSCQCICFPSSECSITSWSQAMTLSELHQ